MEEDVDIKHDYLILGTHLELVQLGCIQDSVLVRVAELEYSPKGSDTILLEDLRTSRCEDHGLPLLEGRTNVVS